MSNTITTGMFEHTPKVADRQYRTSHGGFFNNKSPKVHQTLTASFDDNEVINNNLEGMRLFNIEIQGSTDRKEAEANEPSLRAHSLKACRKKKDAKRE